MFAKNQNKILVVVPHPLLFTLHVCLLFKKKELDRFVKQNYEKKLEFGLKYMSTAVYM